MYRAAIPGACPCVFDTICGTLDMNTGEERSRVGDVSVLDGGVCVCACECGRRNNTSKNREQHKFEFVLYSIMFGDNFRIAFE